MKSWIGILLFVASGLGGSVLLNAGRMLLDGHATLVVSEEDESLYVRSTLGTQVRTFERRRIVDWVARSDAVWLVERDPEAAAHTERLVQLVADSDGIRTVLWPWYVWSVTRESPDASSR